VLLVAKQQSAQAGGVADGRVDLNWLGVSTTELEISRRARSLIWSAPLGQSPTWAREAKPEFRDLPVRKQPPRFAPLEA